MDRSPPPRRLVRVLEARDERSSLTWWPLGCYLTLVAFALLLTYTTQDTTHHGFPASIGDAALVLVTSPGSLIVMNMLPPDGIPTSLVVGGVINGLLCLFVPWVIGWCRRILATAAEDR